MKRKHKKPLYTGELARPIRNVRLRALSPSGDNWRDEIETEKLELLLRHYDIKTTDPHKWRSLVLCLARAHVKGFQVLEGRGPGRPRKRGDEKLLREAGLLPKVSRGRPPNDVGLYRQWVELVDDIKKKHTLQGKGADKKAIEVIFSVHAKMTGASLEKLKRTGLPKFQKRLSHARKVVSKIPKNKEDN